MKADSQHTFRATLALLFLVLFCPCAGASAEARLGEEEYAVYAAVLTGLFTKDPSRFIVLVDETHADRWEADAENFAFRNILETLKPLSDATLADYRAKNREVAQVKEHPRFKFKYRLIEKREWSEIFKDGASGWDAFYQKFSGSIGYVRLSRVGFNARRTEAFVYVENSCGGLCGSGTYVLLLKAGDVWKIHKQATAWLS